ncbi:hypothetical protein [Glutamicibacter sp. ZJUTW]|uniref:hypothetical protein n=1 Tax=Glutamicibacter sp. ZJUTW TaxID=1155384 RepID=UPI0011F16D36|nr:hypothetical protein [Glutamicibacter sp. ZJUTW]QEP08383.1 hypothetical protein F0M17_14620 [Glutamicibacter sp. ZJUTW]
MSFDAPVKTILSIALASGLLSAGSFAAHAAGMDSRGLSYSVNGGDFRASPGELFGGEFQLVPGDRLTEKITIRNDRPHPIAVTLKPMVAAPANGLQFEVAGDSVARLAPKQNADFALEARLPASAGNSSEGLVRSLSLEISAVEVIGGNPQEPESPEVPQHPENPDPPDADGEQQPDELKSTGFSGWAVPLALGMAGAGAALYLLSKRNSVHAQAHRGDSQ